MNVDTNLLYNDYERKKVLYFQGLRNTESERKAALTMNKNKTRCTKKDINLG